MLSERIDGKFFILIFSLGLLFSFLPFQPQAQELAPVIKEGKSEAGIPFLSGGVGIEEREMMRAMERGYNTKLIFAMISGQYLAGVEVSIEDASGKALVKATSQGPWFYVKLPPGQVKIKATVEGKSIIKKVEVGKGFRVITFHWKR